jgi:hypothetical protein
MPIVVDEVVISVEVENAGGGARASSAGAGGGGGGDDKQALIAECVERVLEVLAQRQER